MSASVATIVVVGLPLVMVLAYAVSRFNNVIQLVNNLEKAWANVDVLLAQRHVELGQLVEVCRGYMEHERDVLVSLTRLRAGYDKSSVVEEKIRAENEINEQMCRLDLLRESYPELRASEYFLKLQERISTPPSRTGASSSTTA